MFKKIHYAQLIRKEQCISLPNNEKFNNIRNVEFPPFFIWICIFRVSSIFSIFYLFIIIFFRLLNIMDTFLTCKNKVIKVWHTMFICIIYIPLHLSLPQKRNSITPVFKSANLIVFSYFAFFPTLFNESNYNIFIFIFTIPINRIGLMTYLRHRTKFKKTVPIRKAAQCLQIQQVVDGCSGKHDRRR